MGFKQKMRTAKADPAFVSGLIDYRCHYINHCDVAIAECSKVPTWDAGETLWLCQNVVLDYYNIPGTLPSLHISLLSYPLQTDNGFLLMNGSTLPSQKISCPKQISLSFALLIPRLSH